MDHPLFFYDFAALVGPTSGRTCCTSTTSRRRGARTGASPTRGTLTSRCRDTIQCTDKHPENAFKSYLYESFNLNFRVVWITVYWIGPQIFLFALPFVVIPMWVVKRRPSGKAETETNEPTKGDKGWNSKALPRHRIRFLSLISSLFKNLSKILYIYFYRVVQNHSC